MTIRTILVDDETLAIQGLALRLQDHPDVEIIETCNNGREAIRAIKTHKPDLVFLDIQMPGFDGFSVVSGLADIEPPLFVFVTAYSDHAIRAFEAQATDYLMKPVEEDRLSATMERVRQRLAEKKGVDMLLLEAGEALRFDRLSIETGVEGVTRVLAHMGMIEADDGLSSVGVPARANRTVWVRSPRGGVMQAVRTSGDPVRQGEVLARVAGLFGEEPQELASPVDGIVIGHATLPVVHQGDALFHIAAIDHPDRVGRQIDSITEAILASEPQGSAQGMLDEDEVV